MLRKAGWLLLLVLGAAGSVVAAEAPAAGTARIAGVISPPGKATKVGVVDRIPAKLMQLCDKTIWGKYDPKTGEYAVENLSVVNDDDTPKRYDLVIETPEGRTEGVYLCVKGEEKLPTYDINFATKQLSTQRCDASQYFEEGQVVTPEERDQVIRKKLRIERLEKKIKDICSLSSFNDTAHVLYIHGTPERAAILIELMRKTAFYAEKGDEMIWRIETWPFEWQRDVWHKPNKGLRVWQRLRMPGSEFNKIAYVWAPALGGIEVKPGETTKVDYKLPEKFSDNPGHLRE